MLGSVAIRPDCTDGTTTPSGRRVTEGNDRMKRVVAAVIGLVAGVMLLMACSDNKGTVNTPAGPAQVSTSGNTEVKVDGNDLAGLDMKSVTCVKQAGKITVASGAVGGQQGLGVLMTDGQPPKVDSVAMVVDGNALSVSQSMGMNAGKADVKVDGNTYTITGEAQGADIKNPMAGMITKPFTIKVSCS
jgi:ipoprotein LpqH